ncbi:hypothetical protein FRC12_024058, partial [Ceratobasidium sp. 428]
RAGLPHCHHAHSPIRSHPTSRPPRASNSPVPSGGRVSCVNLWLPTRPTRRTLTTSSPPSGTTTTLYPASAPSAPRLAQ